MPISTSLLTLAATKPKSNDGKEDTNIVSQSMSFMETTPPTEEY